MVHSLQYGRKVISSVHLAMQDKWSIKKIQGNNLRRLRNERHLTQDQLGAMLDPPVDGSHIAGIEAGNGVSDDMLARLCNALDVDLWEFSWSEKAPIVKDPKEQAYLIDLRQAEAAGIAERAMHYVRYMISTADDRKETPSEGGDVSSHHATRDSASKKTRLARDKRRAG